MNDDLKVDHEVKTELTPSAAAVRYMSVRVLAADGIFKQGKRYGVGDEAVLESGAAERLESIGEVEILGAAEAPESES